MSQIDTATKIIQFIHHYSSPELFEELPILIHEAFKLADEDSRGRIKHCALRQSRKRSQDRYFYVQDAVCNAQSGWRPSIQVTENEGESYTELETANMLATIHVPSRFNGKIRRAKYRDKNARHNIGICEQLVFQLDAKHTPEKTKNFEKLNLLIVAQAPSPEQQQDRPTHIQILVPHENNKGYHLRIGIDELLAGFATAQPPVESEDQAWPKLRKQMRQAESDESNEQND